MSTYPCFLRPLSLPLATLLGVALATTASTQLLGAEAARIEGFTQADGNSVFALFLKPTVPAAKGPRDVVILVSTAASQVGDYRAKSLATLQSTLSSLGANDRVKLIAFDLNATPLTQGFVAPNSPEMAAAVAALDRRTPLGSCDLEKALDSAVKSYSGDSKSPRAIVYIGDGSSRANVLSLDQLDRLVNDLVAQRAPVIAFGVGPQIQEQMLGILASRTGGMVVPEEANVDAAAYGIGLADAVRGTVLWPKAGAVKWPEGMEVYPKNLPPLRSDRDTVLVGATKSTAARQVDIDVDSPGGPQKLTVDIPELKADVKNAYLVSLVNQAKIDDGRTLPLTDSVSLLNAKKEIEAGARGLNDLARKSLEDGNTANAEKLASEALKRDPNDLAAQAIKDAIAKKAAGVLPPITGAVAAPVVRDVNVPASVPGDLNLQGDNDSVAPPNGAAAAADIGQANALEERWQKDVQNTINKARSQVSVDPNAAEIMVQNKINDLMAETELRPEMRDRLMGMLHVAGREIKHRKEEFIFREQQRIREEMARREQEMTNEALQQDQNKVKQLMDRYDSLMAEGRHRLAEESAAFEAQKVVNRSQPDAEPLMVVAAQTSRFTGAYDDIMAVRVAKQKGFVDSMYQVEKSHIPTADDPPIVYPDAEVWKELTARRKEKYSATELSRRSPTEKKIEEALKQPTQIEFVETPLKDVVDYLKDLHHIEIQLDGPALKEAGVDDSTPVTKNLKGISLRSALKLLLDELQLKYVVHNEVLLITSPAKAESDEYMTTKVYPVADLVLPIKDIGMSGMGGLGGMMGGGMGGMMGGMGGGMMGGMGGMGGGMMGGMGGMGGGMGGMGGMGMGGMGMGGMGMGGMGGGMFNIPREILPAQ